MSSNARELAGYASSLPNFRNKLINGTFDFWQRGTSQTSSGYGSADRWNNNHSGSSKTASQQAFTVGQTEVPDNPKYYLRTVVTSSTGAANNCSTQQRIEGVTTLAGQTVTLSFWAKADSNKDIATEFTQDFGTGGSPSSRVDGIGVTTHSLTTSWQKFTVTSAMPSISGKTIGTDNNDYIRVLFFFEAGSDFNSRTNSLGHQSGTFDIAQVQFEKGTVATPFEHRPISVELSLCQRYYNKLSPRYMAGQFLISGEVASQFVSFPVQMRASPTVTYGSVQIRENSGGFANVSVSGNNGISASGINLVVSQSGAATSDSFIIYAADLEFNAEL